MRIISSFFSFIALLFASAAADAASGTLSPAINHATNATATQQKISAIAVPLVSNIGPWDRRAAVKVRVPVG